MLVYWILFAIPVFAACSQTYQPVGIRRLGLLAWLVVLSCVTGFRYRVGGDWFTYIGYFQRCSGEAFLDLVRDADPLYLALNWISAEVGGGIWLVNLIVAIVFFWGCFAILRTLAFPWLGMVAATPYLIIVVGMGYSRQAFALGFVMAAFICAAKSRYIWYFLFVLLASAAHKSAIITMPIALVLSGRNPIRRTGFALLGLVVGYEAFAAEYSDKILNTYVFDELTISEGATIRLAMNALPGAMFMVFRARFRIDDSTRALWTTISLFSLAMFAGFLLVGRYSTAFDRIALYFTPLQIVVPSFWSEIVGWRRGYVILGIVLFYLAVLAVWLGFASHAKYWIPYDFGVQI